MTNNLLLKHIINDEKPWVLLNISKSIIKPFAIMSILVGLLTFLGYFFNLEFLYRPFDDAAATNPLTAILFLLLGFSIYATRTHNTKPITLGLIADAITICISTIRLLDASFQTEFHSALTPFQDNISEELLQGKDNAMGINTAIMFFLLSISSLNFKFKFYGISQVCAFFALCLPFISMIGYAYGFNNFHGQMSLYTTLFGIMICFATLLLTADKLFLNGVLSPYIAGRLARYQIVISYIIPAIAGPLIVKSLFEIDDGAWFGAFTVAISWFIFMQIGTSTYFQEIIDRERRGHEKELAIAALHDPMTNIPNRRMFFECANKEFERIKRSKGEIYTLILDIDNFKNVNDLAGHQVGDKVIIQVANILKDTIRTADLIARIGGEEFIVLLLDTNLDGAKRVAESLRTKVENMIIPEWTPAHGAITVSIGGASSKRKVELDAMIKAADTALYVSKENGKNQFTISSQDLKIVNAN